MPYLYICNKFVICISYMTLSIIIVSWNVKDMLRNCLRSIYSETKNISFEVIVVDNCSKDGSMEMIRRDFPRVKVIANKKNAGFAVANNQGIKLSKGDFILLLNPDTIILDKTIKKSVEFMNKNKDCGVMGPKILNPDKTIQPSVRKFPEFWPIFLIFLKLPKIFPNLKSVNNYLAVDFNYKKTKTAAQVMGAFMLIRKEILEQVGLLDENFFIWFEEVDFCKRVWDAGYKVCYNSATEIIHYGGQSFKQQKVAKRQFMFFKSAWRYFKKHGF